MKSLHLLLIGFFGTLSVFSLLTGQFYVGILEMLVVAHNFSDYHREAK